MAYMTEPGSVEIRSYTVPDPEPGAALMQIVRANVCGSELHIWNGKHPVKRSGGLGHEMVGVIESLGTGRTHDSAGDSLSVGDRVVAPYFITCESCFHCRRGEWNLCDNAYRHYVSDPEEWPHFNTAFATHFYISPRHYVYKVPVSLPDSIVASANCALSQVLFGIDQTGFAPGDHVVIQGVGGLGLYATAVLSQRGVTVTAVDAVASRLELAKRFGAQHSLDLTAFDSADARAAEVRALTEGRGADGCIEVTGVPAAFSEGMQYLRRGGEYLVMGNLSPGSTVDYDPGLTTRRALSVTHVDRYEPRYLKKALDFLEATIDVLPYETLADVPFGLDQLEIALNESAERRVTRASIIPGCAGR